MSDSCDPIYCSPPGSSVHGISQARILEWVVISFSRGSSPPRDQTCVSCNSCTAGRFFTTEPAGKPPLSNNYLSIPLPLQRILQLSSFLLFSSSLPPLSGKSLPEVQVQRPSAAEFTLALGRPGFTGGTSKELTCQCRRQKRCGFDPWVRMTPWRRKCQPTPVFLPIEFHGQRSLVGYSP